VTVLGLMSRPRVRVYGTEYILREPPWAEQLPVDQWRWQPFDAEGVSRLTSPLLGDEYSIRTNYQPASHGQQVVLVFSLGVLNPGLLRWFREYDLKYFFIDFEDFTWRGTVSVGLAGDDQLRLDSACLRLSDVSAVLWNPPSPGDLPIAGQTPERRLNRHLRAERWIQILKDLPALLPEHALWLPGPPSKGSWQWQNKLSEYLVARRAGLDVPDTITTNDPTVAREFIEKWKGRVVFKEFSHALIRFKTEFVKGLGDDRLTVSPVTFQQYIDKEYEIRVVVVGDKVFACRIDSQASELARIDWRVYDNANVRWDRMRLPRRIERGIVKLMRSLDLLWGSVDLAKAKDGRFYFFEVNRPGSQYWLLPYVGLDTTKEIAGYLAEQFRLHRGANVHR